jgi:NitT/TauT family transport system permease protein
VIESQQVSSSPAQRNGAAASQDFLVLRPARVESPVQRRGRQLLRQSISIASPLFLLLAWEATARLGWIDTRFFPAPSAVLEQLQRLTAQGTLQQHVGITLGRIAIGFTMGAVPGLVVGIMMGLSPLIRAALQPLVGALFPIPKIAVLPLLMLIFGLGEGSKYAIVAVGVFFQVLISTIAGVVNIDRIYFDVGKTFHTGPSQTFRSIAFPGALPVIFAGFRLGWGTALLLLVTAEMVSSKGGLGFLIWQSWQTFSVEEMYAGLITISFIGFVSFLLIDWLERIVIPWKPARGR